MLTLKDIGEHSLIARLTAGLTCNDDVIVGPGDDCAVVRTPSDPDYDWVITSDPVVQGIHFLVDANPEGVGHKAIGRALSDIAAMGAEPCWAMVNIISPPTTAVDTIEHMYEGIKKLAEKYSTSIVGGDVSQGPVLELHVFAIGRVPSGQSLLRSGAKAGDSIYATGSLGGSYNGKHLSFDPRIDEGLFLRDWATACIDISDGLATDIHHLAEMSNTGALINADTIPMSDTVDTTDAIQHALRDGEDFELLFCIPPDRDKDFSSAWKATIDTPCTRIGIMTEPEEGIMLRYPDGSEEAISPTGYEHFAGQQA